MTNHDYLEQFKSLVKVYEHLGGKPRGCDVLVNHFGNPRMQISRREGTPEARLGMNIWL